MSDNGRKTKLIIKNGRATINRINVAPKVRGAKNKPKIVKNILISH